MYAILGITCTLQLLMLLCILGKYIGPNYVPDFRLFKMGGRERMMSMTSRCIFVVYTTLTMNYGALFAGI